MIKLISSAGPSVRIAKGSVDRCSSIAFMELPRCCHIKLKIEALATGCAVVKLHCLRFTLGHVREDPKEIVRTSLTILWFKSDHATPPSGRMHVDHLKSIDFRSCDHDSPGVADCASELKRVGKRIAELVERHRHHGLRGGQRLSGGLAEGPATT
jgi:hypothetical protein